MRKQGCILLAVVFTASILFGYFVIRPQVAPANEVRLVGSCGGKYYAFREEDEFPQGCDWIESADHLASDHFQ